MFVKTEFHCIFKSFVSHQKLSLSYLKRLNQSQAFVLQLCCSFFCNCIVSVQIRTMQFKVSAKGLKLTCLARTLFGNWHLQMFLGFRVIVYSNFRTYVDWDNLIFDWSRINSLSYIYVAFVGQIRQTLIQTHNLSVVNY